MLGDKLKKIIEDKKTADKNKVSLAKAAKSEKEKKELSDFKKLVEGIKKGGKEIADGDSAMLTINKKDHIRVTDTRKISKSLQYVYHHNGEDISFFKLYSKEAILVSEVEKLKSWAEKEGISDIIVHYEHDGVGNESWNSYWFSLKESSKQN